MALRIVLADDSQMMREGINAILQRLESVEVVDETDCAEQVVEICKRLLPDVALIDLELSGWNGVQAVGEITRNCPEVKVIVLSSSDSEDAVLKSMNAGVRAFVLKSATDQEFLDALRTVAQGGTYLSPSVADRLLNRAQQVGTKARANAGVAGALTPRELEVLKLIAGGKSSQEVAGMLNISIHTVRCYRQIVMRKVGAGNVATLTRVAFANGFLKPYDALHAS